MTSLDIYINPRNILLHSCSGGAILTSGLSQQGDTTRPQTSHTHRGMAKHDARVSSPQGLGSLADILWRASADAIQKPVRYTLALMCRGRFDGRCWTAGERFHFCCATSEERVGTLADPQTVWNDSLRVLVLCATFAIASPALYIQY